RPDGTFEASQPGSQWELITFDEDTRESTTSQGVFQGVVRLYQPGRPEFEKLIQRWVDRYGHLIRDLHPLTRFKAEGLARSWCEKVPGATFVSCEILAPQLRFQG